MSIQTELYDERRSPRGSGKVPPLNKRSDKDFGNLVNKVFSHQKANFLKPEGELSKNGIMNDEMLARVLSQKFYEELYSKDKYGNEKNIILNQGTCDDGEMFSLEDFIHQILGPTGIDSENARNNVNFLVGNMGVGKSALISFLITTYLNKNFEIGDNWFVRVDLEEMSQTDLTQPLKTDEFVMGVAKKVKRICNLHGDLLFNNQNDVTAAYDSLKEYLEKEEYNYKRVMELTASLIREIKAKSGRTCLIIFDNIDYLTHIRDRSSLELRGETPELSVYQQISNLLHFFFDKNEEWGRIGANILCVSRDHTYRNFFAKPGVSMTDKEYDHSDLNVFHLPQPDWEEVLIKRYVLLDFGIDLYEKEKWPPGNIDNLKKLKRYIENNDPKRLYKGMRLIDHLRKVTNGSLRDLLGKYFKQFSWLPNEGHNLAMMERFMAEIPIGLLAYYLNGNRVYGGKNSGVPNIYIIDNEATKKENITDHSYWLKRIILEYIKYHDVKEKKCDPETLVDFFHQDGNGYEKEKIRSVLGTLCSPTSFLIQAEREPNSNGTRSIDEISLTQRGLHCLDNVFETFSYLQIVVDDHKMPIPDIDEIWEEFKSKSDYGYIVADDQKYSREGKKMITLKARQILIFLGLLDVSQKIEKKRFPDLYNFLDQKGIKLPKVEDIKNEVIHEINKLKGVSKITDVDVDVEAIEVKTQELMSKFEEKSNDFYGLSDS